MAEIFPKSPVLSWTRKSCLPEIFQSFLIFLIFFIHKTFYCNISLNHTMATRDPGPEVIASHRVLPRRADSAISTTVHHACTASRTIDRKPGLAKTLQSKPPYSLIQIFISIKHNIHSLNTQKIWNFFTCHHRRGPAIIAQTRRFVVVFWVTGRFVVLVVRVPLSLANSKPNPSMCLPFSFPLPISRFP